jgi:hypothetical protein
VAECLQSECGANSSDRHEHVSLEHGYSSSALPNRGTGNCVMKCFWITAISGFFGDSPTSGGRSVGIVRARTKKPRSWLVDGVL